MRRSSRWFDLGVKRGSWRLAAAKALIVLVPSYTAAWLTDKMVYVVPTLAAASFFAAGLSRAEEITQRKIDDEGPDASDSTDEVDQEGVDYGPIEPVDLDVGHNHPE